MVNKRDGFSLKKRMTSSLMPNWAVLACFACVVGRSPVVIAPFGVIAILLGWLVEANTGVYSVLFALVILAIIFCFLAIGAGFILWLWLSRFDFVDQYLMDICERSYGPNRIAYRFKYSNRNPDQAP